MPSDPLKQAKEKLTSKEIDFLSIVEFLRGLVEKEVAFTHHLDSQTHILIGISSALFFLSITSFQGGKEELSLLIIGVFSALSTLVGLMSIHPPRFMRKQGQEESLMFSKNISKFASSEEYTKELTKVVTNHEKIIEQFGKELYNLSKYYYRPKRILYRLSRNLLLLGIGLGLFSFLVEILVKSTI